jgi:hypothetical protein
MNPIIKFWLFREWGIEMIGQIHPTLSKGHKYILAATDHFTMLVETVLTKNVASKDVVSFVKEHIIY